MENSTELMFAPHPSTLPTGEEEKQSTFLFYGRSRTPHERFPLHVREERRKAERIFVLREEQNNARAIPSPRGRGRKAERIFILREEQNTTRAIPSLRGRGRKQSAFCFTGGAEHRTSDSLSPGEREKSGALFVLQKEQNTARAIPSPVREGEKQSAFLFYGKSITPHERFPLPVGEG